MCGWCHNHRLSGSAHSHVLCFKGSRGLVLRTLWWGDGTEDLILRPRPLLQGKPRFGSKYPLAGWRSRRFDPGGHLTHQAISCNLRMTCRTCVPGSPIVEPVRRFSQQPLCLQDVVPCSHLPAVATVGRCSRQPPP